jgi:hypothetical protein
MISGTDLPGRTFRDVDGSTVGNVHVGVQVRSSAEHLVPGDAAEARWEIEVDAVTDSDGAVDFRGPAVQGRRGERFVYLTWGNVGEDGSFHMFRRAKLMLDRIDAHVVGRAVASGRLDALVRLRDDSGGPRCARVDPPAITWTAG